MNSIFYSSLFLMLILIALPFNFIGKYILNYNMRFSILLSYFIILLFLFGGTKFQLLNISALDIGKLERAIIIFLGSISWYLFFLYLLQNQNIYPNIKNLSGFYLLFLYVISLFLMYLLSGKNAKSAGLRMIFPYFLLSIILISWGIINSFSSKYGYFVSYFIVALFIALLSALYYLKYRQWADIILSWIFILLVILGIIKEALYFHNSYNIWIASILIFLIADILITLFYLKLPQNKIKIFDILRIKLNINNNIKKYLGGLFLFLIVIFFLVGIYLITPYIYIVREPVIFDKNVSLDWFFSFIFILSILVFLEVLSFNKITVSINYILIAGIILYGFYYLLLITPNYIINTSINKFFLWIALSALIFYQPTYDLIDYLFPNKTNNRLSLRYQIEKLIKKSKLLRGRYQIPPQPDHEGGTANVYFGYDYISHRYVVLKVPIIPCRQCSWRGEAIPPSLTCPNCRAKFDQYDVDNFKDAVDLLKKETDALNNLQHPSIVKHLDFFSEGGKTYLVEEKVVGSNIYDFINKGGSLSEQDVIKFTKKVLATLNYVHIHGILHRDLNAGNIMILNNNDDIKIIDFGTAKFKMKRSQTSGRPSQGGSLGGKFGTFSYSPPEWPLTPQHFNLKEPTFSYDIFSVGTIMYLMLTGQDPEPVSFDYGQGLVLRSDIKTIYPSFKYREDFDRILSTKCSKELKRIILKATAFDPNDRFQSAFEMLCNIEKKNGEFILTNEGKAYELPLQGQSFKKLEIIIDFKQKTIPEKEILYFDANRFKSITIGKIVGPKSKGRKKINLELVFDIKSQQYKINLDPSFSLYYSRIEKGEMITNEIKQNSIYLGRSIMIFSLSKDLNDLVFVYYRVG